jgi:hypothetical protein
MRTAKKIFENVVASIELHGTAIAYMVACGEELCIFDCHTGLQKLLLELQAAESVESARSTLRSVFNHAVVRRGSGCAEIRPTALRSAKEIEAASQTAIDGIEDGLSTLELEFKDFRESHAALSNWVQRLAVKIARMEKSKDLSRYWKIVHCESGETLGAVSAEGHMKEAMSAARSVFGRRIPFKLIRIDQKEFVLIQNKSRRVAEFVASSGS